jgi:hypothetical protein
MTPFVSTSFNEARQLDPEKEYLEGLRQELVGFLINDEVEDQGRQQDLMQGDSGLTIDFGGVGRICLL